MEIPVILKGQKMLRTSIMVKINANQSNGIFELTDY